VNPAIALACENVAKLLNHTLEHDPVSQEKLKAIDDKALLIQSTAPPFAISILFSSEGLSIIPSDEPQASSHISGSALDLLRFAIMTSGIHETQNLNIEIHDDDDLLRTLFPIIKQADIDWEGFIAEHIGDVPAHLLGDFIRNARATQQDFVDRSRSGWAHFGKDAFDSNNDIDDDETSNAKPNENTVFSTLNSLRSQLKTLLS